MGTNFNKLVLSLGIVCLSTSYAFADDMQQTMKTVSVPPGTSPGEQGPDMFVSVDYTLWTARQAGLEYAVSNYYSTPTSSPSRGSVYYPDWKLCSGFKVGLGAYLNHDMWDIQAEYTWFYNKHNGYKSADFNQGQAQSTWYVFPNEGSDVLNAAWSKWNNWFNRVDVQLARNFFAGHYLALRPFIGLLGAWDCQWFDVQYVTTDQSSITYQWKNKQQFWGIGPYSGLDASFCFPVLDQNNQWSIFLDTGFSLPWSQFKAKQVREDITHGTTGQDYENKFWNVVPMIELALGLRWETWWADNKWMFLLQAAWEEQVWFDHNNFFVMGGQGAVGNGNYTMQGLTLKAKVAF